MISDRIKQLGSFTVTSGELMISDPCYARGTWCQTLVGALNGVWQAYVMLTSDGLVHQLMVVHDDYLEPYLPLRFQFRRDIELGVDSGQLGVFDNEAYPTSRASRGEYDEPDTFYGTCCDLTIADAPYGVLPYGVVCRSGYGDGEYFPEFARDEDIGKVVGVRIAFVDDSEV